jgi:hypothetical protein
VGITYFLIRRAKNRVYRVIRGKKIEGIFLGGTHCKMSIQTIEIIQLVIVWWRRLTKSAIEIIFKRFKALTKKSKKI